jgi:hypothetical protein
VRSHRACALILAAALVLCPQPASPDAAQAAAAARAAGFAPGEQLDYDLQFLHLPAGHARLSVGRAEGAVWPLVAQARTDGLAALLDIREHYVSYWDAETGWSRGAQLDAYELGDRHSERARFDRAARSARVELTRKGQTRASTQEVPADVLDVASALLQLRLRPLGPGERLEVPVFFGTRTYPLVAQVEGREVVETRLGKQEALRVRVSVAFEGKFRTTRDSHVWLSTDGRRIPLRISADFALGSVTATLSAYRPGEALGARWTSPATSGSIRADLE